MSIEPKVSVVVPVYGVEKYLRQCVDSILAQTLKEIEVILVDDGSRDRCPEMVDEYAARDSRVVALHQPNGGYGKAVNYGLREARGEYIGIIEPDDWIDPDMYRTLYDLATRHGVQVVRSDYYAYTQAKGDRKIDLLPQADLDRVIEPRHRSDVFYCRPTVWAALYRRDFLRSNDIWMLETPGASYQDVSFNFKVLARAQSMWLSPQAFVHYRSDNQGSSTAARDKVFCIFDEWDEIDRYMSRYPEDKASSATLCAHVRLDNFMWHLERIDARFREEFRQAVSARYSELLSRQCLRPECFTRRKWMSIRRHLEPGSVKVWGIWLFQLLTSFILKPKMKNTKRCWYAFFGLIKVSEQEVLRPSFLEGRR